jgi:hypothetical protein
MSRSTTRTPALPSVPASLDQQTAAFLRAVKEVMETRGGMRRGSDAARYVTKGELDKGLGVDITTESLDLSDSVATLDVPDAPRDLTIVNEVFCNNLSWTNPSNRHVSHIEIWAAEDSQSRDDALILGYETIHDDQRGKRATFTHSALNIRKAYTYWLRSVTHSGVYSPWCPPDGQGGYIAPASIDKSIEEVMGMLTGDGADGLPFVTGVVAGEETVGLNGNLVIDGSILTRMLAAGLVTADKVSAEDVFTMNLQSGNYSPGSSGFKIDAINGTAEFYNISLRISNPATVRADLDVEEGATNDSNIYYPGTTYINGGNIHADSSITIGNTVNGDYCIIDAGDIEFWQYINGAHRLGKSLKRIESGSGNSNTTVTLPGYWKTLPYLQVSLKNTSIYNKDYPAQNQAIECYADNLSVSSSGICTFVPRTKLVLTPSSGNLYDTETASMTDLRLGEDNTYITTSSQTTPNNTVNVTVTARFRQTKDNINYIAYCYIVVDGVKHQVFYVGGDYKQFDVTKTITVSVANKSVSVYAQIHMQSIWIIPTQVSFYVNVVSGSYVLSSTTLSTTGQVNYIAIGE